MQPKYKRILLKLSGEAMAGEAHTGLDFDTVLNICKYVKEASELFLLYGFRGSKEC